MRLKRAATVCTGTMLLALTGCLPELDLTPVEEALGTAVTVGWVADQAMAAAAGGTGPCVGAGVYCGDPDCRGELSAGNGADCVLPMSPAAEGTVGVQGSWVSADNAVFAMDFATIRNGERRLVVIGMTRVAAQREEDRIYVGYVGQDIKASNLSSYVRQTAWVIEIDTSGTPADPNDDTLLIYGGSEGAGIRRDNPIAPQVLDRVNTGIDLMAMIGVHVDPHCALNPVSGHVILDGVTLQQPGATGLKFHDKCDGEVDVLVSASAAFASSGQSVPIDIMGD